VVKESKFLWTIIECIFDVAICVLSSNSNDNSLAPRSANMSMHYDPFVDDR